MSSPILLRGMTWNHPRGHAPMIATSQAFCREHPDVQIAWEKRSLQEFADQPIDRLAGQYDLLVIDHPWAGFAAKSGVLLAIDQLVPADFIEDQARNSVGQSHPSYIYNDHLWALAIDAATPVAAYRPDLLERAGIALPKTWVDVMEIGGRGLLACPSIPLDVYCNFLNLLVSAGATIFPDPQHIVARADGRIALDRLRELASVVPSAFFEMNPIRTLDAMSSTNDYAYCPYTYGYSNYARPGYATHLLQFADVAQLAPGRGGSTLLGGTGLAISSKCRHPEVAAKYAQFVASPETQRGIYFESGGQPGHRAAWLDETVNRASSNFFLDTLPTLDRAFLRPRNPGYLEFQDRAGDPIHAWLRNGGASPDRLLDVLDELYRQHGGGTQ